MSTPAVIPNSACDPICAICETGDALVPCGGFCLRSFHSDCIESGDRPPEGNVEYWACFDCMHGMHKCYICKQYGKDEHIGLWKCRYSTCGKYFHKKCVASDASDEATFVCPSHACKKCGSKEETTTLSKCFRCTEVYCRQCKPSAIVPLARNIFMCVRHTVELKLNGVVPAAMYKNRRVVPLEKRCRMMDTYGFKEKLSESGEADSGERKESRKRLHPENDTVDWGNMNASAATFLASNNASQVPVPAVFEPATSSNDAIREIEMKMKATEESVKRRRLIQEAREKKKKESAEAYAKVAAAKWTAASSHPPRNATPTHRPAPRTAEQMIALHDQILLKVKGWITQRKGIISMRQKYLDSIKNG